MRHFSDTNALFSDTKGVAPVARSSYKTARHPLIATCDTVMPKPTLEQEEVE